MTQRIPQITEAETSPETAKLFEGLQAKMGKIINIFKTMGHAPSALEAYLNFSGAMAKSSLTPAQRELIALAVAGANHCDYCASAHTQIGKGAGLSDADTQAALNAKATDAKTQALVTFARTVNDKRGNVSDADVKAMRDAGWGNQQIVEAVAVVSLNVYTNFFNHVAGTEVDFPLVSTSSVAKAA
ncbi:MAG: peroxidase-related enzyme [Alphaproteobacteria bacterium]|nr:peroxidase-related enzyme [Alphaproteobacteria bacterium]